MSPPIFVKSAAPAYFPATNAIFRIDGCFCEKTPDSQAEYDKHAPRNADQSPVGNALEGKGHSDSPPIHRSDGEAVYPEPSSIPTTLFSLAFPFPFLD